MAIGYKMDVLLRQAWTALDGDLTMLDRVEVVGDGPGLLPSTLAVMPAMTAAVSASTLAASVLDAARRSGAPRPIVVDCEHVAVASRSERCARSGASREANPFAPLSRFWQTADGWLRLHANYPWHRERALQVLETDERPEAVEAAVRRWRGEDLEEALAVAGALGYTVRSRHQWLDHPQGRAVAALPLLQSESTTGPSRTAAAGRGAVGLRVLDLTRVIAGPVATRTLAAWGAEVLRIDSPNLPEIPAQAVDTLPGKHSAVLDLTEPMGRSRMEELLGAADLVVQGYRPGALARYGLDPIDLAERHPHVNIVTLSAWGPSGPWAGRRGFDSLVQCPTGIAFAEGINGRPGVLPAQALDHATGYLAAAAGLLALAGVQRGEAPRSVRLSLAQTAHWLINGGDTTRDTPHEPNPDDFQIALPGAAAPVHVISPPGRTADLVPHWTFTTDLGADPPMFTREDVE